MAASTEIPGWAKGVLLITGAAAVAFVGYKIYKAVQNFEKQKGSRLEDKAVSSDLKTLISQGKGPTISSSQAAALANEIFSAMDGWGTDNKQIIAALNNAKNDADVLAIIDAFGTKEISSGALNPEPNYKGRLPGAIVSEMPREGHGLLNWATFIVNPVVGLATISNGDIGINTVNEMFNKKGIKFRF